MEKLDPVFPRVKITNHHGKILYIPLTNEVFSISTITENGYDRQYYEMGARSILSTKDIVWYCKETPIELEKRLDIATGIKVIP